VSFVRIGKMKQTARWQTHTRIFDSEINEI